MSDRIDHGARPWKAIPRDVLRDPQLSPRAKGGLVTLLSHDDGWVRSVIGLLMRENRCGKEQAQSIMRELCEVGYAEQTRTRQSNGRFVSHYRVGVSATSTPQSGDPPQPGLPAMGKPAMGTPLAEVEALDVRTPRKARTPKIKEHARFAAFYDPYPRKVGRKAAAKAFDKAVADGADPEVIVAGARRFGGDPNLPPKNWIPHPSTWLSEGRWDDEDLPERGSDRYETAGEEFGRRAREVMANGHGVTPGGGSVGLTAGGVFPAASGR